MPEELGDGLYLALVGMGLVFFSLVVFMLILLALQRLFPGEEVAEVVEEDYDPAVTGYRRRINRSTQEAYRSRRRRRHS